MFSLLLIRNEKELKRIPYGYEIKRTACVYCTAGLFTKADINPLALEFPFKF